MAAWSEGFEALLRHYSGAIPDNEQIDPDTSLSALGIDSLDVVELIIDLEDLLGLQLPQHLLTPEAFATPSSLWNLCCDVAPTESVRRPG